MLEFAGPYECVQKRLSRFEIIRLPAIFKHYREGKVPHRTESSQVVISAAFAYHEHSVASEIMLHVVNRRTKIFRS